MTSTQHVSAFASKIDHTLLKADAGERSIIRLCDEARLHGFVTVCVQPSWVRLCAGLLKDAPVGVCTVIGFPQGCNKTETKLREAELALADGAVELDMVLHLGRLKDKDMAYVENDIRAVVRVAGQHASEALVKVIVESCLLSEDELRAACTAAVRAGADYVKTSTGFSTGGATVDAVRIMRATVGEECGVKASGGIRTAQDAIAMVQAGADRLGTSSGVEIISSLAHGE
jgi:deoxyribose-phosphate aldolase